VFLGRSGLISTCHRCSYLNLLNEVTEATAVKIEVILASRQPWWSEYKGKALKDLIEIKTFDAILVKPLSCRFPT